MTELREGSVDRWLSTMDGDSDGDDWHCGCCGRAMSLDVDWCNDCLAHLRAVTESPGPWDRTWFAQTGEDCPFQAGGWAGD